MLLKYLDYHHDNFGGPTEHWPRCPVEVGVDLHNSKRVADFFEKFDQLLGSLYGYGPVYDELFKELGVLEGYDGMRFFRADTGYEYTSIRRRDGTPLRGDEIAKGAFSVPYLSIDAPRSLRPLKVREDKILHVVVDADFHWWGECRAGYEPMMLSYSGEFA